MTELEKLAAVKVVVEKLADGINPITNLPILHDSVINDINMCRYFCYIADILSCIIKNNGGYSFQNTRTKLPPFYIDADELNSFKFYEHPVVLSKLASQLNSLVDSSKMRRISPQTLAGFLADEGLLKEEKLPNGKYMKLPTPSGREIGISTKVLGLGGEGYVAVLFNKNAQQYLIENLPRFLHQRDVSLGLKKTIDNQPQEEWTSVQDATICELFGNGFSIAQMAQAMKLPTSVIISRLKFLGLR